MQDILPFEDFIPVDEIQKDLYELKQCEFQSVWPTVLYQIVESTVIAVFHNDVVVALSFVFKVKYLQDILRFCLLLQLGQYGNLFLVFLRTAFVRFLCYDFDGHYAIMAHQLIELPFDFLMLLMQQDLA